MTEPLQFDGEFWLPADPTSKLSGVVTFTPTGGGTLSVIGSFADIFDRLNGRPVPNYRRILGETDRGNWTLDDCRLTSESPMGWRQRFAAGKLLRNVHYELDDAIELDRLVARISDLRLWVLDGAPRLMPDPAALAKSVPIVKEQVESIPLEQGARLELVHRVGLTLDVGRTELRQSATPWFEFDAPVELDAALEHALDLLAAITIASDRVVAFEDVNFAHPDVLQEGGPARQAVYLYEQWLVQADPARKLLTSDRMAFTYRQIGGVAGLGRLLEVVRRYRWLVRQVLRPRYDEVPTVQDSFFTRVAALEGYDKAKHGDDIFLRKRLKRLFKNVAQPFGMLITDKDDNVDQCRDARDSWCDRMVKLRNNIGHGDLVPLHQSAAELHEMSESAYWLFVLNILVEAKAPHAVYNHLMTKSRRFLFLSRQVKRHF
jgi:hypothetical protein